MVNLPAHSQFVKFIITSLYQFQNAFFALFILSVRVLQKQNVKSNSISIPVSLYDAMTVKYNVSSHQKSASSTNLMRILLTTVMSKERNSPGFKPGLSLVPLRQAQQALSLPLMTLKKWHIGSEPCLITKLPENKCEKLHLLSDDIRHSSFVVCLSLSNFHYLSRLVPFKSWRFKMNLVSYSITFVFFKYSSPFSVCEMRK